MAGGSGFRLSGLGDNTAATDLTPPKRLVYDEHPLSILMTLLCKEAISWQGMR